MGFCFFNNVAVAAREALQLPGIAGYSGVASLLSGYVSEATLAESGRDRDATRSDATAPLRTRRAGRMALLAPLLLTSIGTTANLSFQDVSTMVKGVYGDKPIEDLEYSVCVAAYAEDMLRDRESSYVAGTQGQQFVVKAAVLLWLYLDQTCARYAEEVRDVGGLLVIGTSLQESKRVELQLRGRAGRQGDPGETAMICDAEDPVLKVYYQSADMSTLLGSSVSNLYPLSLAPDMSTLLGSSVSNLYPLSLALDMSTLLGSSVSNLYPLSLALDMSTLLGSSVSNLYPLSLALDMSTLLGSSVSNLYPFSLAPDMSTLLGSLRLAPDMSTLLGSSVSNLYPLSLAPDMSTLLGSSVSNLYPLSLAPDMSTLLGSSVSNLYPFSLAPDMSTLLGSSVSNLYPLSLAPDMSTLLGSSVSNLYPCPLPQI
eukprot:gene24836-10487_t